VQGDRFDIDELDPEDPFEIDDGNRPHLYKHMANDRGRDIAIGPEDLVDAYTYGNPVFYEADPTKGDAEWIMIGEVPGVMLVVPLAPPVHSDSSRCRPIGIYQASEDERRRYMEDQS
jgi:hypothetical protein